MLCQSIFDVDRSYIYNILYLLCHQGVAPQEYTVIKMKICEPFKGKLRYIVLTTRNVISNWFVLLIMTDQAADQPTDRPTDRPTHSLTV